MNDKHVLQMDTRNDTNELTGQGTMLSESPTTEASPGKSVRHHPADSRSKRLGVGAIRYSGLFGIALLVAVFAITLPGVFLSEVTLRTIISNQAITGILALGALIPLAANLIDLSFGAVAGLALVITIWFSYNTDLSIFLIVLIALAASTVCGLVSGMLVAYVKLDSFIVTLGMSSLVLGLSALITGGDTLYGTFDPDFVNIGQGSMGPIPYLTIILVLLALAVWVWLEHTPAGRYTQAVGSNPVAAKLAGISLERTQILTLVTSSLIAGFAGVLLAAQVGNGSTAIGPGYLLPVIAALFLGATQVRERPNVIGTVIAIFLLGTGIKGLQLAGASTWATDTFNGSVLLIAVAAAAIRRRQAAVGG